MVGSQIWSGKVQDANPTSYNTLGLVYTMDQEDVPCCCKSDNWLLNSSGDYFGLQQRKNGRVTMEVEVPKIHTLRHSKWTYMIQRVLQWGRQERWYGRKRQERMAEKFSYNESYMWTLSTRCLHHIIAHETYHFYLALSLKLASTCFTKQCQTFETQEFECMFVFLVYQLKCLEFGGF